MNTSNTLGEVDKYAMTGVEMLPIHCAIDKSVKRKSDGFKLSDMSRKQKAMAKAISDHERGDDKNPFTEAYTASVYDETMRKLKNV